MALKKPPSPDWPYALILDQIKARQKAKTKTPSWLENENVIFPPSYILEQASSEATAKYKAALFSGKTFLDLTGGAGIDAHAIAQNFETITIIDADETAAELLAHNMNALNLKSASVHNISAEDFVQTMQMHDHVLIDPQRRNETRKGLYRLEDCSPNILTLLPSLKAHKILLKTSPMLDIDQSIETLACVSAVHIIEWQGECKEVLYVLTPETNTENIPITAVKLGDNGKILQSLTFTREEETTAQADITPPQKFLYEPSPAFMKSGAYKTICAHYDATKIHAHTHLYTSGDLQENFPGRSFEIIEIYPAQAKALPFTKANLAIRNFPSEINALKKKLKIKDGGSEYLFACTFMGEKAKEKHGLIHCRKMGKI